MPFTFKYPYSWKETKAVHIANQLNIAFESPGKDLFNPGFVISGTYEKDAESDLLKTKKHYNISDNYASFIKQNKQYIIESKQTTLAGEDCFVAILNNYHNKTIEKIYQISHEGYLYSLEFFAPEKNFKKYGHIFDKIAQSFAFKKDAPVYNKKLIDFDVPGLPFTFEYSSDWVKDTIGGAPHAVGFHFPGSASKFIIFYSDVKSDNTEHKYTQAHIEEIAKTNKAAKEVRGVTVAGNNAVFYVFENHYPAATKITKQYRFYNNGKEVLLEFKSQKENLKDYEPIFDAIIESLKFKD